MTIKTTIILRLDIEFFWIDRKSNLFFFLTISQNIVLCVFLSLYSEGYNIHVNNSETILHPNKTSILTSPVAITSQARCFSMQWLTKGSNPGNLTIFLITDNETKAVWRDEEMKKRALPSKAFKNGEILMWQTAFVDLPTKTNFKVSHKIDHNRVDDISSQYSSTRRYRI